MNNPSPLNNTAHSNEKNGASGEALFSMSGVTLRVRDTWLLADTNWEVRSGENWAVIGPNGAGKTTLMRAITGQVPIVAGKMMRHHPMAAPEAVGYVSFEFEQQLIDRERAKDEAHYFSGRADDMLLAGDIIFQTRPGSDRRIWKIDASIDALDIRHLLDREIRHLSSGELRRIFIARALLKSGGLLVLDEPFDSLDSRHRRILGTTLDALMDRGIQVILVSHHIEEIPEKITRVIALKGGRVFCQGLRKEVISPRLIDQLYGSESDTAAKNSDKIPSTNVSTQPIIDIRKATVRYGPVTIFKNLSWRVNRGENWAISGPNGSGKTTLLRLITGDHLQAYANEIYLFGLRRGTGESIWEIKNRFGVVSAELQHTYRKKIPALDVVRSGFFDSTGLYRSCTEAQQAMAAQWIKRLNVTALMDRRYDQLSFGERKMILIARAMVKSPEVLILDEPCQGLDQSNRRRVLALVDQVGQQTDTQIIFVTHRPDEVPACTTHFLNL